MSSNFPEVRRGLAIALAAIVAVTLTWRVLVTGVDALRASGDLSNRAAMASPLDARDAQDPQAIWRTALARNPADYGALLTLALHLERDGKKAEAIEAGTQALRLAPSDQAALNETAKLFLRQGDESSALAIFRRLVELYPGEAGKVWPIFAAALDTGRHGEFFAGAARDSPLWWPGFFGFACGKAALDGVQSVFAVRVSAGTSTPEERRCIVARLQREGKWMAAYQTWLNSLPADQRQRVGFVFNGGFESPLSYVGFDWLSANQDAVSVTTESTDGATGRRALHVTFVNKRYAGPPVYEYLLLQPGQYRFEGRGRAEGLNSWLGLQWGLYCHGAGESRQLARSDALLGTSDWNDFHQDFVVSRDCPVQILRLELANPRRDANSAGNVAVRLRGSVWFDDLKVKILD